MEVKKIRFNKEGNLEIEGINEKGKKASTYIAIPPPDHSRVDIISTKELIVGYNFDCEDSIIIRVTPTEKLFLWVPKGVVVD